MSPRATGGKGDMQEDSSGMAPSLAVTRGRKLFKKINPGAPGKLGRTSTKAESLSKLRGRGALA